MAIAIAMAGKKRKKKTPPKTKTWICGRANWAEKVCRAARSHPPAAIPRLVAAFPLALHSLFPLVVGEGVGKHGYHHDLRLLQKGRNIRSLSK